MESLTGRIGANTRAKPQLPSDKTPNSSVEQVTVVEPRFKTSNALDARRPSKNRSARWKSRLGLKRLSISGGVQIAKSLISDPDAILLGLPDQP
jgi:hypothetical protein